ncbi:MAG: sigma-70 family RNA polymerase sigma factor [Armatimonadetes bacterium]|nr:sigma-70 family RNA polymerase sigma factor [Armatimonadota bacterium]
MHVKHTAATEVTALVTRARQGDRDAFDVLVERYTPFVFNLTLRITGSREEAEDCVQEAFLRTFSSLRKFREEAAFSTWLYRVAVNVANDAARRLKVRPLREADLSNSTDDAGPDLEELAVKGQQAEVGPEASAIIQQRRQVVIQAVRRLPEHHRTVIVLYDLQGLSYDDIARVLGVRVGTVKSRLNRARLALKDLLLPHLELLRD